MGAGSRLFAWSRPLRRLLRPFLSRAEKKRVAAAIARAEARSTGEIHVHLVGHAGPGDILEMARRIFFKLGLDKTRRRNAVLILICDLDHRFAIWGDEGVHAAAGLELWDKAREILLAHFSARRYAEGVEACVAEVGRRLAELFPRGEGPDDNELPDEISRS